MFTYGLLSIVLVLYLTGLGFDTGSVGLLLSFALIGDTVIPFLITTRADRIGRKRLLQLGSVLMLVAVRRAQIVGALRHIPDGRSHPPVAHDGRRTARGALGRDNGRVRRF